MKRRKAWMGRGGGALVALLLVALSLAFPTRADAGVKFNSPLVDDNGSVSCTNCCTGSSLTANSLIVGGGSSAISALANNGTATIMYATNASGYNSGNPGWRAPLLADITAGAASSVLAGILNDETGGTSKVVFDTNPTIAGLTLTGAQSWGGATAPFTLPAGAIGSYADIANGIKTGGSNGNLLVTRATAAPTAGNCTRFNANGNIEDAGTTCGGSGAVPRWTFSSLTKITVATGTPVYCNPQGVCSTTANGADVQTKMAGTGTVAAIECTPTSGASGIAVTVTARTGACGGALATGTATSTMGTTQWGDATSVSGSTAWNAGGTDKCLVFIFTAASSTTGSISVSCTASQTAGS